MIECDVLVIGAGPAGLTAAQYCARAGYDVIVADENSDFGGLLSTINCIENYPGIPDRITGYDLFDAMKTQALKFGVTFQPYNVMDIEKVNGVFYSALSNEHHIQSKAVILACGADVAKIRVPGESRYRGKGVSYCAQCDGPLFKEREIIVVAKGEKGLEDAEWLSNVVSKVKLIYSGDPKELNKIENIDNINILNKKVKSIIGDGNKVTGVTYEDGTEDHADAVFISVGKTARVQLASYLNAQIENEKVITDNYRSTSIPGFFAAGDVRDTPFKQVSVAVGDGACAFRGVDKYLKSLKNKG